MVETLPRPVRLRLTQTLAQWPHWAGAGLRSESPRLETVLPGGYSNTSVLAVQGNERFVIRVDGIDPHALGLQRQVEWRILQAASEAGLAPQPIYHNPELQCLVTRYAPRDPIAEESPEALARLLQQIHALPGVHHRLDLPERLARYEHQFQRSESSALARQLNAVSEIVRERVLALPEAEPKLCHNDLLRSNRLHSDGKLLALDWEYAAMGDPAFDLAVVIAGDDMPPVATQALLDFYDASPDLRTRVRTLVPVYRYLELLWYLIQPRHTERDQWLLERLPQQLALLAREIEI